MKHDRQTEQAKYLRLYSEPRTFRMSDRRRLESVANLAAVPWRGSLLDVGCGRGAMMAEAEILGFDVVVGVDVVPALADGEFVWQGEAHDLPFADNAFDVVTMYDVIEHLVPGDDEAACRELARVARHCVILTASNLPSVAKDGTNLHINIRTYAEWNLLFSEWFKPAAVTWQSLGVNSVSESWRVDIAAGV